MTMTSTPTRRRLLQWRYIALGATLAVTLVAGLFGGSGTLFLQRLQDDDGAPLTPEIGISTPSASKEVPLGPASNQEPHPEPRLATKASSRALEIRSAPSGAEVFVDWQAKGTTPMTMAATEVKGWLVITQVGYEPHFRRISTSDDRINVSLDREIPSPEGNLFLVIEEEEPARSCEALRTAFLQTGIKMLTRREADEVRNEATRAGGFSNPALRAWARARFNIEYALTARCRGTSRHLDQQLSGSPARQAAAQGVITADATVDLESTDLGEGVADAAISRSAREFGLRPEEALEKATRKAAEAAVGELKKLWFNGRVQPR
jgi:hypothetical protein